MNTVLKEIEVRGVETRTVDNISVLPESCSRDAHPDDLHDGSRSGGSIDSVDLVGAGFKGVDDSDGVQPVGTCQSDGLGFHNCKPLSVYVVHQVVVIVFTINTFKRHSIWVTSSSRANCKLIPLLWTTSPTCLTRSVLDSVTVFLQVT